MTSNKHTILLNKTTVATTIALIASLMTGCITTGSSGVASAGSTVANVAMQANYNGVAQVAALGKAFSVAARLTPGDTVKVGEAMVLQVQSPRAGRVWVIGVDASDKADLLFPNEAYRDNAVMADVVTRIPPEGSSGRLIAAEPRGDSRLLVVVTGPDQTLDEVVATAGGLRVLAKPEDKSWAATMVQVKVQ